MRFGALGLAILMTTSVALAGERPVSIEYHGTLSGTLLSPDLDADVPAVLLIAGSGPTDRDGNSKDPGVKPATLRLLAEALAKNNIISLRFDKRGVAASASAMTREEDLRFDTYVDDAIAWTHFLQTQRHVRCVVILGHSEGALIGALAAAKTDVCGYISIAGAGFPADEVILRQIKRHAPPSPAFFQQAESIISRLKKGESVAEVPPQFGALFRPSVQPYLISWFRIDPAEAVAAVKAPVLLMQGTTDIQVSVEDVQRLAKAAPRSRLVLLDSVNHVLKPAPAELQANIATYGDPAIPLAPKIVPTVVNFVNALP